MVKTLHSSDFTSISMSSSLASTVCGFARRALMLSHASYQIIGLSVFDANSESFLTTMFDTIPGSTDLVMDTCMVLNGLNYTLAPEIQNLFQSNAGSESVITLGSSNIRACVYRKTDVAIAKLDVTKQFSSKVMAFTTDDLNGALKFFGLQKPQALFRTADAHGILTLSLYLQEVKGVQTQKESQMSINHVFTEKNKVYAVMPASATNDFLVYYNVHDGAMPGFDFFLEFKDGDPRADSIADRAKQVLLQAIELCK